MISLIEAKRRVHEATNGEAELLEFNGTAKPCIIKWNDEVFVTNFYPLERGKIKGPPSTTNERRIKSCVESRVNIDEDLALQKRIKTCKSKWGASNVQQNETIREKTKNTNIIKYGHVNPMQDRDVALRSAKNTNKCKILKHWKTQEDVVCKGSYEVLYVEYLNFNRIDFKWQIPIELPSGKVYFIDCQLETGEYVEIKGRKFPDWLLKWNEFLTLNLPYILVDRDALKKLNLKVR